MRSRANAGAGFGTPFNCVDFAKAIDNMTERQESFREDMRFMILRVLEANPEYSQRDIANALGISLGGVNYCLRALIEKGHIKVANFQRSSRKLRYAYVLTPSGLAERALLTRRFLQRKVQEYEAIKAEIDALTQESLADDLSGAESTKIPYSSNTARQH